jgi:hypothetical protein
MDMQYCEDNANSSDKERITSENKDTRIRGTGDRPLPTMEESNKSPDSKYIFWEG